MKLYTYDNNPRTHKVLIVAKYAGVKVEVVSNVDFKSADFLQKSPTGKVPVLETEGGAISESNAIARYLARQSKTLYGKSALDAGLIDSWVEFAASEVELPALAWIFPIQGVIPNNPLATKKAQEDIKKVLQILDNQFLTRTYIVGNTITLADIVLATALHPLYQLVLDPAFRGAFVNTNRWYTTIVNQPEVKAVLGDVQLCEKAQVAQAAKKEEKKPKAEKPKAEPKAEKPKAEKKPEKEDDGEEGGEEFEEPKKKNPLDDLPKSAFVMDEWKRTYSNNDTRKMALPWFFEHLDKAGYSIWKSDYKYDSELTLPFKASNLIGGFFQRLEKLHKYAFGSMIIFGEENALSISGVWLFRGLDIPEDMKLCDDSEHYNWTRLDTEKAADKKTIEDYFAWDGELGGKKFNAGKTFK